MTTGSVGSVASCRNPLFQGVGFGRTWNGGDGKTEFYAGLPRQKWNYYTSIVNSRLRPSNSGLLYYNNDPNSPYVQPLAVGLDGFGNQLEWENRDELRLQSRLLKKVKSHQFNLAINLAQMDKVSRMVVGTAGMMGRAFMALRHGDFATAARTLGTTPRKSKLEPSDLAGRWLELQYGWQPALHDAFEGVKAFHELTEGPRRKLFRTSVSKKATYNGSQSPSTYQHLYDEKLSRKIVFEQYEEMDFPRQLGLLDPLSVTWELIPYSFVVDWFIPIGTYLDNLNQIPKLRGRFAVSTTRRRTGFHDFKYYGINRFPGDAVAFGGYYGRDTFRETSVDRTISTSLAVPLPTFDTRGAVHGRRVWNAISLLQLRFTGRSSRYERPFQRSIEHRIKTFRGNDLI